MHIQSNLSPKFHLYVTLLAIGLFCSSSLWADARCRQCASDSKPLPEPSRFWEAQWGSKALPQSPFVEVILPYYAPALEEVAALAHHIGTPMGIPDDGQPIKIQMSTATAKAMLDQGVPLTVLPLPQGLLNPKAIPVNDECSNALSVILDMTYTGSTLDATDADVWYTFTPTLSAEYQISLAGSLFDTTLYVYEGCAGKQIGVDDDGGPGSTSELKLVLAANETYAIKITGFAASRGDYQLKITQLGLPTPGATCIMAIPTTIQQDQTGDLTLVNAEVWFSVKAPQDGFIRFSAEGSNFDTVLTIYDGCGGEQLGVNDDFDNLKTSVVLLPVTLGETYMIELRGYSGAIGNYRFHASIHTPQPGEFPQVAIPLSSNTVYTGDTEPLYDQWVWYRYTPTQTSPVAISLLGSQFDTILVVCDEFEKYLLGYNDDSGSLQSRLSMDMKAGQTYLILIAGWGGETGTYRLELTPVSRPVHDQVAFPQTAYLNTPLVGSTDGSTSTLGSSHCGESDSRDVWYTFASPLTGFIRLDLNTDEFDPTITFFDQEKGSQLACAGNEGCSVKATVVSKVTQGTNYLIRIAGQQGTTGAYTLMAKSIMNAPPTPPSAPIPSHQRTVEVSSDLTLTWNHWTALPLKSQHPPKTSKDLQTRTVKLIYGYDNRRDEYQIQSEDLLAIGDATVVLMDKSSLIWDANTQTYEVPGQSLIEQIDILCSDEPYIHQPSAGFCSGFLVAPDLIVTAGHCTGCEEGLEDIVAVFGFVMADADTPVLTRPASEVYVCQELVASQLGDPDWGLIRLDRPVKNHRPLSVRHLSRAPESQPLTVIGYPMGLPRKYDTGGTVRDNWMPNHFSTNLDTYGGNSGSAVLNSENMTVEGILVRGFQDFIPDYEADCFRSLTCPDTGCPGWEEATRITLMSDLIPSYDVFLGTTPGSLAQILSHTPVSECHITNLTPGHTYYWQVVSHFPSGEVRGPVWSFTLKP